MAAAPARFTAAATNPYQPSHDQKIPFWSTTREADKTKTAANRPASE